MRRAFQHEKRIVVWSIVRSLSWVGMPFVAACVLRVVLHAFANGTELCSVWTVVALLLFLEGVLRYGSICAERNLEVLLNDFRQAEITRMLAVVNSTAYEYLESDQFWRSNQHAVQATRRNFAGNEGLIHDALDLAVALASCVTAVCILATTNGILLLLLLPISVVYVLARMKIRRKVEKNSGKYNSDLQKIELHKEHMLDAEAAPGYQCTNAYSIGIKKLHQLISSYLANVAKDNTTLFAYSMLASILILVQNCFLYGAMGMQLFDVAELLFQISTVGIFLQNMEKLAAVFCQMEADTVLVEKYDRFLQDYGRDAHDSDAKRASLSLKRNIELKNICFGYGKGSKDVLRDIHLTIHKQEHIAIIGPNGAGKSTLVHLIMGLLQEKQGQVFIDGTLRDKENLASTFSLFSSCFQQPCIFPLTVWENVGLCEKSEMDWARYEEVIRFVGLEKGIAQLPQGKDTLLSFDLAQGSGGLSGGERQRLALARALYKDSPVLIFDEPSAALDPIAEVELFEKLTEFTREKTLIYITHRLSCAKYCDRIVYMRDGRIAEMGTHEQLMQNGGEYATQYRAQRAYYQ